MALLTLAVLVRLGLSLAGWPETDSDEATIGLAALHIARDGAHPAYFYGQDYMGTLEAWLGAAAFRVLGVSTFTLRLGVIALTSAGFAVVYRLALALYDRRVALGSLALLLLGSEPVLYLQVKALGGHVETLLFGALCLLLATRLAQDAGEPHARPWPRRAGFAGWGLSAGLGLWSHLLVAPFVLASTVPLLACCRREMRGRALPWLLGGAPMGAHDLAIGSGHRSSLAAALGAHTVGGRAGAAWLLPLGTHYAAALAGVLAGPCAHRPALVTALRGYLVVRPTGQARGGTIVSERSAQEPATQGGERCEQWCCASSGRRSSWSPPRCPTRSQDRARR